MVGIDLSSQMVFLARSNAADAGADGVEFAVMDAQQLEFADALFDHVGAEPLVGLGWVDPPVARSSMKAVRSQLGQCGCSTRMMTSPSRRVDRRMPVGLGL